MDVDPTLLGYLAPDPALALAQLTSDQDALRVAQAVSRDWIRQSKRYRRPSYHRPLRRRMAGLTTAQRNQVREALEARAGASCPTASISEGCKDRGDSAADATGNNTNKKGGGTTMATAPPEATPSPITTAFSPSGGGQEDAEMYENVMQRLDQIGACDPATIRMTFTHAELKLVVDREYLRLHEPHVPIGTHKLSFIVADYLRSLRSHSYGSTVSSQDLASDDVGTTEHASDHSRFAAPAPVSDDNATSWLALPLPGLEPLLCTESLHGIGGSPGTEL